MPDFLPVRRYRPEEGMLLLAPSHYRHRTIPSGADEDRISIAFDVIADDASPCRPGDGRAASRSAGLRVGSELELF